MKITNITLPLLLCFAALAASGQPANQNPQPDNTKVNKRDRSKAEPTADQQKMNASDRDLTQKIRKAILDDKSLSTYAHNIKVISQDGAVTLKGPVRSAKEKEAVVALAASIAGGSSKVTDEVSIKR